MARLFSINFSFQNTERLALVSVREKGADLACQVRYVDKQLSNLLCGKYFAFNLPDGLQQSAEASSDVLQSLMLSTVEAVKRHLENRKFSPSA